MMRMSRSFKARWEAASRVLSRGLLAVLVCGAFACAGNNPPNNRAEHKDENITENVRQTRHRFKGSE